MLHNDAPHTRHTTCTTKGKSIHARTCMHTHTQREELESGSHPYCTLKIPTRVARNRQSTYNASLWFDRWQLSLNQTVPPRPGPSLLTLVWLKHLIEGQLPSVKPQASVVRDTSAHPYTHCSLRQLSCCICIAAMYNTLLTT